MLYVYYGNDTQTVREAAMDRLEQLQAAGYTQERIEAANFTPGQVADVVESVSLFGASMVYVLDEPGGDAAYWQECISYRKEMAASEHVFVLITAGILAADKKKLQASATEMAEHSKKAESFNTFAAADALLARDKKQLWILLQQAAQHGAASEELIGILWWQLKMVLLAAKTSSADEAGVSSYPYQKAKRALATFPEHDAERLAQSLLALYHDGHGGERDIWLALEEWVLRL